MRHNGQVFVFAPLTTEHFPLMHRWLNQPHVALWWGEPQPRSEVDKKYQAIIASIWIESFIVYCVGKPIGFLQCYRAKMVGDGWWPGAGADVVGIDQFIGEAEFLHKGYGPAFIRQYVTEVFAHDPTVNECIADPAPSNSAAIKAYEKSGFKQSGLVSTPDGTALLMRFRRSST